MKQSTSASTWLSRFTAIILTSLMTLFFAITINNMMTLTSCGSISGHLVTIPYQIIKHIPTSALLEA